jgi:cytochrome b6-f complex iron-sulfur subunit
MTGDKSSSDTKKASPPGRRRFLGRLAAILGGLVIAELGWVATAFIRPRKRRQLIENSQLIVAGPAEAFAPGSATAFPEGKFYLARLDDGGFMALHRRCTHLGCTISWEEDPRQFVCPCHASSFDLTGAVLTSPASRPLDLFTVRLENGIVKVDTSQLIERAAFVPEQVKR